MIVVDRFNKLIVPVAAVLLAGFLFAPAANAGFSAPPPDPEVAGRAAYFEPPPSAEPSPESTEKIDAATFSIALADSVQGMAELARSGERIAFSDEEILTMAME